jgi:hypothetical protein
MLHIGGIRVLESERLSVKRWPTFMPAFGSMAPNASCCSLLSQIKLNLTKP